MASFVFFNLGGGLLAHSFGVATGAGVEAEGDVEENEEQGDQEEEEAEVMTSL